MRNYLLARGLWELTQGTANAPDSKSQQELDLFNRRFYQTNSILVGSCSRDITLSLEWSTDPHATWNYLENQYQPLGISQRYEAFMDFMDLRYDGKNITNVLPTVPGEASTLSSTGHRPRQRSDDVPIHPGDHPIF